MRAQERLRLTAGRAGGARRAEMRGVSGARRDNAKGRGEAGTSAIRHTPPAHRSWMVEAGGSPCLRSVDPRPQPRMSRAGGKEEGTFRQTHAAADRRGCIGRFDDARRAPASISRDRGRRLSREPAGCPCRLARIRPRRCRRRRERPCHARYRRRRSLSRAPGRPGRHCADRPVPASSSMSWPCRGRARGRCSIP